jgi:hypothetical protein
MMALERRAVQKHRRAMVCKVMQREAGGSGRRRPARAPYTAVSNINEFLWTSLLEQHHSGAFCFRFSSL